MKDVSTETAHGQPEVKKPVLPPLLDIQLDSEQNENEFVYTARITLGKRIPRDGPEKSRMRMRIASIVLAIWVAWLALGFIWLLLTGDSRMLLASPALLMIPLGIVLRY